MFKKLISGPGQQIDNILYNKIFLAFLDLNETFNSVPREYTYIEWTRRPANKSKAS